MDIRISDLSIGYDTRQPVARHLSAEVPGGRLTCLLGRNGAGKTTLLKTLTGALPPLAGTITIGADNLRQLSRRQRAQRLSIVTTERLDLQRLTVRDVVALGRHPYTGLLGTLTPQDKAIVDEALHQVGITPLARRDIALLSDGERQKVLIAKALAQQTPVIILDEPTAFLDHPSRCNLFALLRHLAQDGGKTILLSTHDWELAAQYAHRFLMLDEAGLKETRKLPANEPADSGNIHPQDW